MPMMTPSGVPVLITSPGLSVMNLAGIGDHFCYRENHIGGAAVLAQLAIQPALDRQILRIGNLIGGHDIRTERQELVQGLAEQPLPAEQLQNGVR